MHLDGPQVPDSQPLLEFLDGAVDAGGFPTDDLLGTMLPLLKQCALLHARGQVAPLEGIADLRVTDAHLWFENRLAQPQRRNPRVDSFFAKERRRAFEVIGERRLSADIDSAEIEQQDLAVATADAVVDRPLYLPGYVAWEHAFDHHDPLTDIYCLGMLMAALACGLDFAQRDELERFTQHRRRLHLLAPNLHPTVLAAIVRMTTLDPHRRPQDLSLLTQNLEHYREQGPDAGVVDFNSIRGFKEASVSGKCQIIQSHLRDRLFEVSRRNRLLYFKPTMGSLNLTVSSVPVLLHHEHIRAEQLLFWHEDLATRIGNRQTLDLNRYLRIEDAPYIPGVLDKIRSEARRDRNEYGFSQLRLVLVFLRWHNLKESPQERIDSPLLLLPVELEKKKGIADTYRLVPAETEAEVNPILRHHLKQLYGLNLPDSVDLSETTMAAFFEVLRGQIAADHSGIELQRLDRPRLELVHESARLRLDQYRRRVRLSGRGVRTFEQIDYCYRRENFQPLGVQLFQRHISPSLSPFKHLLTEKPSPRSLFMVAPAIETVEKQMYALQEGGDHNPYSWDFDLCSLTLGNFNYRKMSLVRDYASLLEDGQPNPAFENIFSLQPRDSFAAPAAALEIADQHLILDCDPTQLTAISRARSGRSYIIQGPPGTGKSQTITNLIADYVARGQRVLFVCEKRAAIDVVYHRLHQAGLDELCTLIHDSQRDKKAFVMDLKKTYETFLKEGVDEQAETDRQTAVEELGRALKRLQDLTAEMQATADAAGVPLRQLLQRLVELRGETTALTPAATETLPNYSAWLTAAAALRSVADILNEIGADPVFSRHPLCQLSGELLRADEPINAITPVLERCAGIVSALIQAFEQGQVDERHWADLDSVKALIPFAVKARPLAACDQLQLLVPASPEGARFETAVAAYDQCQAAHHTAAAATRNWLDKLPPDETQTALELARATEGSWWRFLNPAWWNLRKILRARYQFSTHAVKPKWSRILAALLAEHEAAAAVAAARQALAEDWKLSDVDQAVAVFKSLGEVEAAALTEFRRSLNNSGAAGPELIDRLADLNTDVRGLVTELDRLFAVYADVGLRELQRDLDAARDALHDLPDLLHVLLQLERIPVRVARALRRLPLTVPQYEAATAAATLGDVYRQKRWLLRFDHAELLRVCEQLGAAYAAWRDRNGAAIRARVRNVFAAKAHTSTLPAAQLSDEEKALKRRYRKGRRELEHEFDKTMRYRAIRDLANDETGIVIADLKPVWLMSPLSVSDTLPMESGHFDVVIFDEASQVPVEEAVPALHRGRQVIVVGDEMQLPPTTFFAAAQEDESLTIEEGGEVYQYDLNAESFLSQAARNLPATLLGWHYRSRYEALISFSNCSFYGGELLTIPDRNIPREDLEPIVAGAAAEGADNVAALLQRSISFHFLDGAVYEKRRNRREAEYIAELVRRLLDDETGLSIGIVAFSEAQQEEIERALSQLGQDDTKFRNRLEQELEREEDGQFCGLLVKNLENIQGDERDIIIISVCYGYDIKGKMLMNFGPINKNGGEKRLNVIFSRAKQHMAVVSSIHAHAITNEYNDGANCLRNFLAYAEAVSGGDRATADHVLQNRRVSTGSEVEFAAGDDAVVTEMAAALRGHGLEVATNVGESQFRCDLAVRRPGQHHFALAVLLDTHTYYRQPNPLDHFLLRPSVLRAFGWQVENVLIKDWYHDPAGVTKRLLQAIEEQ